jgi:hypothetical protein
MTDRLEMIWMEFAWRDWRKARNVSVGVAGVPVEIRIESLPNTGLETYCHTVIGQNDAFKFNFHALIECMMGMSPPTVHLFNLLK